MKMSLRSKEFMKYDEYEIHIMKYEKYEIRMHAVPAQKF